MSTTTIGDLDMAKRLPTSRLAVIVRSQLWLKKFGRVLKGADDGNPTDGQHQAR